MSRFDYFIHMRGVDQDRSQDVQVLSFEIVLHVNLCVSVQSAVLNSIVEGH